MADAFILNLKKSYSEPQTMSYQIDSDKLVGVEKPLVKGGNIEATIIASSTPYGILLKMSLNGNVSVECNRCLDIIKMPISVEENIKIRFDDNNDDDGEIISVNQAQTELDLWPLIYDLIILAIPIRHQHDEGQCNEEMAQRLSQYIVNTTYNE